ncbi:MAG: response regulator [Chloroflexi bacterium]|jgi:DNA-binding response OmpR family regulator|nr:MAG: response regulator [Chloroflexota bacterium]HKC91975.1 response regulator [Candidatus Limnocylindria bacterium]
MQRRVNRRVLVIEDDNDIRRLITESLRGAGLDVVAAIDASQALRTALARKPAAVVLDIGLPDYDGTQFIARWRERRPDAAEVPIVIVSGRADRREIASLVGAAYVCGKPFIVDELVDQVERAVLN